MQYFLIDKSQFHYTLLLRVNYLLDHRTRKKLEPRGPIWHYPKIEGPKYASSLLFLL